VGLADLFKKAPKLKADPQVRWFGKLPTYADYYASKGDEAWAVEFQDWVLKGFELYAERARPAGKAASRLPISACALRLPRSGMTVFASLLDYGGDMRGRPFPLCFYAGIPSAQWPGPTHDRLCPANRVMQDLLALRRDVPRFLNSPGRFETAFGERVVNLDGLDGESSNSEWVELAVKVPLAEWFAGWARQEPAALPECPVEPKLADWYQALAKWGDNIARHESEGFEPTLRFPLAPLPAVQVQLAGWIRWLETRMDLGRRLYSVLVSGDLQEGTARFSVVAHELIPDDFLLLTPLARTLPYVDDASRVGLNSTGASEASGTDGQSAGLALVPATWAEFANSGAATN
jgi:hypothetical protein